MSHLRTTPIEFRRAVSVATLGVLVLIVSAPARADQDFGTFRRAVEYCRGDVARPMALSSDKRTLCLDGTFLSPLNLALARELEEGGVFVVRSLGGHGDLAIYLAEALHEKRATVVAYDYCLSACASYVLVASTTAFVLRGTLVAWQPTVDGCASFADASDRGPKRLERGACPDAPREEKIVYQDFKDLEDWFYRSRIIEENFEAPPESNFVRRALKSRVGERGAYPTNLYWTWNPRYYAAAVKTKITYEAYPQSQDEVDAMAGPIGVRVIYDP
jgi:hypothetical protein